jgi:hypothetical protein
MPNEFPAREVSSLVALFQKAHSKVIALARMDDQIAALVVQHERLQEEVRAVQAEINQEFARALKYNQAPAKLPGGPISSSAASAPGALPDSVNGESGKAEPPIALDLLGPSGRLS